MKNWVEFPVHPVFAEALKQKEVREVTPEVKRLLEAITGDHSRRELQELLGLKDAEHFRQLLPIYKHCFRKNMEKDQA